MEQLLLGIAMMMQIQGPIYYQDWELQKDGTIAMYYTYVDKFGVKVIRSQHTKVVQPRKNEACNEVRVENGKVFLHTREEHPMLYVVHEKPDVVEVVEFELSDQQGEIPMR